MVHNVYPRLLKLYTHIQEDAVFHSVKEHGFRRSGGRFEHGLHRESGLRAATLDGGGPRCAAGQSPAGAAVVDIGERMAEAPVATPVVAPACAAACAARERGQHRRAASGPL